MTLARLRAEIANEEALPEIKLDRSIESQIDALLLTLAEETLPSLTTIEALTADVTSVELPAGYEVRSAERRRAVITDLRLHSPRLGPLLRTARGAKSPREIADTLGVATAVWESIEADRVPAAVLNLDPSSIGRATDTLGLARSTVALALRSSLAAVASSGYAFGYRPQQATEEVEPLTVEVPDQSSRIRGWLLAFMRADN